MDHRDEGSAARGRRGVPRVSAAASPRPRLLERLAAWSDITVVHGPLGSGKTTLLASWLSSVTLPVLWCEPVDGRLPFADLETFAAAGAGVLVIDRAERMDAGEFERLGSLIDGAPDLRVALATRSARTAREIAAVSDAALDVLTPADLLFTREELRESGLHGEDGSAPDEVLRRTGGLAIAVRAETEEAIRGTSGARERLRRLLRTELGEEPGRYEAAVRIALLPRVDREILAAWGLPDDVLHGPHGIGLAEWDGEWLRMHPFFREVLAENGEQELPPAERTRLLTIAVRTSFIRTDPLLALRTAFELDDLDLATEVAFAHMIELLESRDETYEAFTRVRSSRLSGYPGLTVLFVLLSNMDPATRPRALQVLAAESLFQRLQPHRGRPRERLVYRVFEAAALRLTPFADRALPLVRRAARDLSALSDEDMDALGRMGPVMLVHLGISAFYLREFGLARQCFELADAKQVEAGRADRVDPLSLRAGLAALTGDMALARRLLAEADSAEWPAGWRASSPAYFLHLGQAVVALEDGDPYAAETHLTASGPFADLVEHWTLFALVRARRDRLAGEAEAGLLRVQRLREQRGAQTGTAMARSLLDAAEAELHLALGNPEAARRLTARSAKHSGACRIALARAELAADRPAAAAVQAQRALSAPTVTPRNRLEAELVLVCTALRTGQRGDAEAIAKRVTGLLADTGVRVPLRTVEQREREALTAVLREAGVAEADTALIATDASGTDAGAVRVKPLTSRELAVLEALAETGTLDEIAARLFVSRNTVKTQLRSLYRKLGVSSREAALARAALLGLLDQSPE